MTVLVAVSQRVAVDPRHGERRDALDQRWTAFLSACGLVPLPLPNCADAAVRLMAAARPRGLLLTGGNSLSDYGGDAPERDAAERAVLDFARSHGLPVLGVCRGMQMILHTFGAALRPVDGHAGTAHLLADGRLVNSYHDFAADHAGAVLEAQVHATDGVIEAVRHPSEPIRAIMWHPERCDPFDPADVALVRSHFLGEHA